MDGLSDLTTKTAKVLFRVHCVLELFRKGYRVLDIGNMDLEYEWYVRGAAGKIPLNKHDIVGEEANRKAAVHNREYAEYLGQVKRWL